jgi:hypothetical protein
MGWDATRWELQYDALWRFALLLLVMFFIIMRMTDPHPKPAVSLWLPTPGCVLCCDQKSSPPNQERFVFEVANRKGVWLPATGYVAAVRNKQTSTALHCVALLGRNKQTSTALHCVALFGRNKQTSTALHCVALHCSDEANNTHAKQFVSLGQHTQPTHPNRCICSARCVLLTTAYHQHPHGRSSLLLMRQHTCHMCCAVLCCFPPLLSGWQRYRNAPHQCHV